jgi:hypothetical protein
MALFRQFLCALDSAASSAGKSVVMSGADLLLCVTGDAEDDEEGSAGDEDGLDQLSDTNAPYAEEPEAGSSKKGALHNMCSAMQLCAYHNDCLLRSYLHSCMPARKQPCTSVPQHIHTTG